jgi:hypothetical protein
MPIPTGSRVGVAVSAEAVVVVNPILALILFSLDDAETLTVAIVIRIGEEYYLFLWLLSN